jgi:hypothetical protein
MSRILSAVARELRHPDWPTAGEWLQVIALALLLSAPDLLAR